jgi:hypothetical protein
MLSEKCRTVLHGLLDFMASEDSLYREIELHECGIEQARNLVLPCHQSHPGRVVVLRHVGLFRYREISG